MDAIMKILYTTENDSDNTCNIGIEDEYGRQFHLERCYPIDVQLDGQELKEPFTIKFEFDYYWQ